MFRFCVCLLVTLAVVGCRGPVFTDLGNGTAVQLEALDALAREKDITRDQAGALLRQQADQQKIAEHAETYGISLDEAKEQLEHAAKYRQQRDQGSRRAP